MLANWITLSRFPLLPAIILILYRGSSAVRLAGVGLLFVGLMLDTVDGMVARRRGQTSLAGSVLDIAADRAYELVLWMCFADLGLIPVVIPLIVVVRTVLTDAFRSVGVGQGSAPFAQHRTALGRFLVASAWMRTGYAVCKSATFCGLALAHATGIVTGTVLNGSIGSVMGVLEVLAWICVAFCVFRGLPVIIHGLRQYWLGPGTPSGARS